MPAPAPARGSSTCFPRRPTTASCRPSLSASARQPRRSRSCRRARRAVTFGPMALVTTPAVVLQTYRYSETSKVVRLATRELGVQSAMAKGVLRPKSPFGAGLELLSEGMAQLYFRETRELHTLGAFDVLTLRPDLAADVGRVAGATALAAGTDPVAFSGGEGGVACSNCTPSPPLSRLPRQAYRDLLALNDARADLPRLDAPHAAAHRRLVARFVRYHFGEIGALSALDFWERHAWTPTPATPVPSAAS